MTEQQATLQSYWLVQRKLPGVQGENGCYADEVMIDATSAEEALNTYATEQGRNFHDGTYRVCEMPDWSFFHARNETTHVFTPNIADWHPPYAFTELVKL